MPPGIPNAKRDAAANSPTAGFDEEAVRTFMFEVSAGNNRTDGETRPPKKGRGLVTPAVKSPSPPEAVQPVPSELPKPTAKPRVATIAKREPIDANRIEPLKRKRTPPWLVSLVLHAAVLLVLSFCTLATLQHEDLGLWASSVPRDEIIEEFPELEIDPSVELDDLDSELPTELEDPGLSSLGELSADAALSEVSLNGSLAAAELSEFGSLFGEDGRGLSDLGTGEGGATTTFFGTEVKAHRILFMLDNSGGMGFNGKFETLVDELLKTIDAMDPKQQFYVVFYSDTVYPLFFPQSEMNFVRATRANKERLRNWLGTVELCMGNAIDEAIQAAETIRPDTVFLLTDGDLFTTEKKKNILLDGAGRRFSIHTFGMGADRYAKYAEGLQLVADANRGSYRSVQVTPEAVKLSKTIRRPYHDWKNGPGTIWGTSFSTPNPWQRADDLQQDQD